MPGLPGLTFLESPNESSREGSPIRGVVIHHTASPAGTAGDVAWLRNKAARASAHFVIGRDGVITQLVDVELKAWHAGASHAIDPVRNAIIGDCNAWTIGVELDGLGLLVEQRSEFFWRDGPEGGLFRYRGPPPLKASLTWPGIGPSITGWWEPYPEAQIAGLEALLGLLRTAGYDDAVANLLGHDEIAMPPGRKDDPGPLFPWGRFPRATVRALHSQLL